MKYYIVAGEASGDLHASNLMVQIKQLDPDARFRGWGGDLMQSQGLKLVKHYRELAFMGFVEVIANLRTILNNISFCKNDILDYNPDVLVLVDYPGFNLRIAGFAKQQGYQVVYYISPQVWAWKQSRVHQIKKTVDRMLCILPFEQEFYRKFDMSTDFVGHPLLDAIASRKVQQNTNITPGRSNEQVIALLPGSRRQEIKVMLPLMLSVVKRLPGYHFKVAAAPGIEESFYHDLLGNQRIELVKGDTYGVLESAIAALVTSGTATLEAALFRVPQVVCYKGNKLSFYIARSLVKVPYISLVNLIMDRLVVTELIQDELEPDRIYHELLVLLPGNENRDRVMADYDLLKEKLGGSGASARAAAIVVAESHKKR